MTTTPPLTDFLLARIAEDAAQARWGRLEDDPADPTSITKILRWDHARLSAECEAKRRIVERAADEEPLYSYARDAIDPHDPDDWARGARWGLEYALRALALSYADHPDYREQWRPTDTPAQPHHPPDTR